jgi:hypothetical protein
MDIHGCFYGLWRCVMHRHEYRGLTFSDVDTPVFFPRAAGEADYAYSTKEYFDLEPADDRPPVTVITHIGPSGDGMIRVRGVTSDDYDVKRVLVNDRPARATGENFAEWEIDLPVPSSGEVKLTARAEDAQGNVEAMPHEVTTAASQVIDGDGPLASSPHGRHEG